MDRKTPNLFAAAAAAAKLFGVFTKSDSKPVFKSITLIKDSCGNRRYRNRGDLEQHKSSF